MNFVTNLGIFTALGIGALACNDETGKYWTGPDDPALNIAESDLDDVRQVLARQEDVDLARGLRQTPEPRPVSTASTPRSAPASAESTSEPRSAFEIVQAVIEEHAKESSKDEDAEAGGSLFDMEILKGDLPEGWKAVKPSSPMRKAQAVIPAREGDPEDGVLTVFYFGPDPGSIRENFTRWIEKFSDPDGGPLKNPSPPEQLKAGTMEAILIELAGTYDPSMPNGPKLPPKPNWRMLAVIVMSSNGPVFLKATGPDQTMLANKEKMLKLVTSLREPGSSDGGSIDPREPESSGGEPIDLRVLTGQVPASWIRQTPSNAMRIGQMIIPRAPGDSADAEVVVSYFGAGQGGSVEANLQRWWSQMKQPGGADSKSVAVTEKLTVGSLKITLTDIAGTYAPPAMFSGPAKPPQPNWRFLGAIIEIPNGLVFVKATGPDKTLVLNKPKMIQFLKSLKPK